MSSRLRTGVWLTPSDGRRWRFDPGSLSLAFGYTGDFGYGVEAWETLRAPADLTVWLAEHIDAAVRPCDDADLLGARQLRGAITSAALRAAAGQRLRAEDVDTVNAWAARASVPPQLAGGTRTPVPPLPAQLLTVISHDAVRTFGSAVGMIRACAADDCQLIFLDTSRPQSRRWCSMSRCGGRAKARTHYARHLEGEPS